MTGFLSKADSDGTTTKVVDKDVDGNDVTTITDVSYGTEVKKDFFSMYEVMNNFGTLWFFQQAIQMMLPFIYIFMLETAVVMVLAATIINFFDWATEPT